jgi:hypothetical protein
MPTQIRCSLLLLLPLICAAPLFCQGRRVIPYPLFEEAPFAAAVKAESRTQTGEPGPRYWTDYAHYDLEVTLDASTALVKGHGVLTYHNRSPKALRELRIHLRQNLHTEGALRNTAVAITGGMTVENVTFRKEQGDLVDVRPRIRGTILTFGLPRGGELAPGDKGIVELDWSFTVPPSGRAPRMGQDNFEVYWLGYWYPQFAVHEDVAGWVSDTYMGGGEFYMGYADYDLRFTAPCGFLVRATGELTNPEEVLTDAQQERLALAAESREIQHVVTKEELEAGLATKSTESGQLTWKFQARNVRDIAVSASNRYVWDACHAAVKDKAGPGEDGKAMVHVVYRPRARFWPGAAASCRHTIEYMSREVFPYPWPHMTCAEGIIGGGMEYPMMTICGTYPSARGQHGVIAHETIHMWWPMIVGTNEKRWSWIDEGITSYMESRSTADYYNEDRPDRGEIAGYRAQARRGGEVEAMRHADLYPREGGGMPYGFATYTKTAAVLHQLRGYVGHEKFDEAMRTFVRRWAYKHPYPRDLFSTINEVAGQDYDWYFRIWFYETWTTDPAIDNVEVKDGMTRVRVAETGLAFGPVIVEATMGDGQTMRQTIGVANWLAGKDFGELTFQGEAVRVRIDPDAVTLDLNTSNNTWPK